jgi:hypothetical protein
LHEAVAKMLELVLLPPAEWTCFPAGNIPLEPRFAAKLARMGLRAGWPDFLVVHRWVYGIELKGTGGTLSRTRVVRSVRGAMRVVEGQVDMFPRLVSAGMNIAVCRSVDEVVTALGDWQVPMRVRKDHAA